MSLQSRWKIVASGVAVILVSCLIGYTLLSGRQRTPAESIQPLPFSFHEGLLAQPRNAGMDESGYSDVSAKFARWNPLSLESVRDAYQDAGYKLLPELKARLQAAGRNPAVRLDMLIARALVYLYEGEPRQAYDELVLARTTSESDRELAAMSLSTVIYLQGIAGLRRGETENCVLCRGEGSCIFPLGPAAVHQHKEGARLAVKHFTEYLKRHAADLGVRWLLNLAYMTLGEYPARVPEVYLLPLARFKSEPALGIGTFREIGHLVGLNRVNMGGGAIMEDFNNDGLLDLVVSSADPTVPLTLFRNKGDGSFADLSESAGFSQQLGGIYCVQTDYDNDGHMDIFVARGAWQTQPVRPSLLHNNGDGTFTDVTEKAGLLRPLNAMVACWADFDNDGYLDLFIGCDQGRNLLFRNKGDGTFEDVTDKAGLAGVGRACRGACWGDFDGDGYPDLLVNNLNGRPHLYRNNRDGTFTDMAAELGVVAPDRGVLVLVLRLR